MMDLPPLAPSKHEHPLKKMDGSSGGWGCDGCGQSGEGKDRYRCLEGCDFDFCGECNAKAVAGNTKTMQPKLMLVDIPDNGGYYEGPEGEVTTASLQKLF